MVETGNTDDSLRSFLRRVAASPDEPPGIWINVGECVGGRYELVTLLGSGGFGLVYQARDRELGRPVAIKLLHGRRGGSAAAATFKREATTIARLNHARIVTVHDFGVDARPEGEIPYLVLELLCGRTLESRLRDGRVAIDEATRIVDALLEGLDHAHAAGVVHLDLKPSNVFLTDDGGVKILDFGLARTGDEPASNTAAGTPSYMAPEQWRRGSTDERTDVFAAGVILHELVTGRRPYAREAGGAAFDRDAPRVDDSGTGKRLADAMARAIAVAPADRFPHARAFRSALSRARAPARRARWPIVAIAVGAALAIGIAISSFSGSALPAAESRAAMLPSVAILGFRNLSARDETAWIGGAISQLLAVELDRDPRLRAIAPSLIARVKQSLPLDAQEPAPGELMMLRAAVGARLVASGWYVARGEDGIVEVGLDLHDTATGVRMLRTTLEGTDRSLVSLSARAARRMAMAVGGTDAATSEAHASAPGDPAIARLYFEGLAALDAGDARHGHPLLEQAVAQAPEDPLVLLALGRALLALGKRSEATAALDRAHARAGSLPSELQMLVDAALATSRNDVRAALPLWQHLFEAHPGNVEYGIQVSGMQGKAGDHAGADATIRELRSHVHGEELVEVDLMQATRLAALGMHGEAARLCERAAEVAERQGAHGVVAKARARAGFSRFALGELPAAIDDCNDARTLHRAMTGREFVNNQHAALAVMLAMESGRLDEALRLARLHDEQRTSPFEQATSLGLQGTVLHERDDPGAEDAQQRAREIWNSICEPANRCGLWEMLSLGRQALDDGRSADAEAQAVAVLRRIEGDVSGAIGAEALLLEADAQIASGRAAEAAASALRAKLLAAQTGEIAITWRASATAVLAGAASDGSAVAALGQLVATAEARNYHYQALLLRLAQLTAPHIAGDPSEPGAREALARDAAALGFRRIARVARQHPAR